MTKNNKRDDQGKPGQAFKNDEIQKISEGTQAKINSHEFHWLDDQGKAVQASNADEVLKKLEAAQESFGNESCWLLDLAQAVEGADWQCLQIISDLDKISERLRKNEKKSTQKSTIKLLTPKVQAKLNKTLDTVLALSALFEKRKRDAGRVSYLLLDEFPDESDLIRKYAKSIKRALKR
jgi:hypothetical protein